MASASDLAAAAHFEALLLIAPVALERFDLDHPTPARCEILVEFLESRNVGPILELFALGLEAIPAAADLLDDLRATPIRLGPEHQPLLLGQLAAAMICGRLAGRTFANPRGGYILHGLADPIQINRIGATYAAGRYRLWAAVPHLEDMLDRTILDPAPVSPIAAIIALCAGVGALADIGAGDAMLSAHRACRFVFAADRRDDLAEARRLAEAARHDLDPTAPSSKLLS